MLIAPENNQQSTDLATRFQFNLRYPPTSLSQTIQGAKSIACANLWGENFHNGFTESPIFTKMKQNNQFIHLSWWMDS